MRTAKLAAKSLMNRKTTSLLTAVSIGLSVCLLLGVEKVRSGARQSFESTLAGTDLIVGSSGGKVHLMLYSIFRIGQPVANVSMQSYQEIANHPDVEWAVPLSLGDSHQGYRVVGTEAVYFDRIQYGSGLKLRFSSGDLFQGPRQVVLGAEVAGQLNYKLGDKITLTHGISEVGFTQHDDFPFEVVGILAATGTPVDKSLHVNLQSLEIIHGESADTEPEALSAFLVGLRSKMSIFSVQEHINNYPDEDLMAILPGAVFQELWKTLSVAEKTLKIVGLVVALSGILGMLAALMTSLNERRREMAILRATGAAPTDIFALMISEAFFLALGGCMLGVIAVFGGMYAASGALEKLFGLYLPYQPPTLTDMFWVGTVLGAAVLGGLIPAFRAYRGSLADGLTIRV